jgi:hypothetical protein
LPITCDISEKDEDSEDEKSNYLNVYSSASKKQKLECQKDQGSGYTAQKVVVISRYFSKPCQMKNQEKTKPSMIEKGRRSKLLKVL